MNENIADRGLLNALGLCARAGKLIYGTENICLAMRNGQKDKKPLWVIEACDCSRNTHKKITDKCTYYKIKHTVIKVPAELLASSLGKTGDLAAVGITDENLCRAVKKQLGA